VDGSSEVKPPSRDLVAAAGTTANRAQTVSGAAPVATPASPRAAASPAKRAAQTMSCDPPYYFDTHGNRLFKKDCL
jgi:hypothetical protein